MALSFTDYFNINPTTLEEYGAFDISLESDLPVFMDPFLLFNSEKPEYRELHDGIINYLRYLRDLSVRGPVDEGTLKNLYCFKEVKQNWLGFTFLGNDGSGLGMKFARSLNEGLHTVFSDFGSERITRSSHLEKVALLGRGVGRDNMSDFVTNLIKDYLLEYTQRFTQEHIDPSMTRQFRVPKVAFNYDTHSWREGQYTLPVFVRDGKLDYVILTPEDILTRDDIWINANELYRNFSRLPPSIEDAELRSRVNAYFHAALGRNPTRNERNEAVAKTIREYPVVVDYYIRNKEDEGDQAAEVSRQRVSEVRERFRTNAEIVAQELEQKTNFYTTPFDTYEDALQRVRYFKHYIENQDGYLLVNPKTGALADEKSVQLYFGLIWFGTRFDVNREPNNGRGPVDYKVSYGASDKSLIEFKLGSNSRLKQNLENQVEIYKAANATDKAIKVIICYDARQQRRVAKILRELHLTDEESIFVIDARRDNKPSASKA
jgi:hypothetical protein